MFKHHKSAATKGNHHFFRLSRKFRLLLAASGFLLLVALLLWIFSQPKTLNSEQTVAGIKNNENPGESWWNEDYHFNINVKVANQGETILPAGTTIKFSLNHQDLVNSGQSREDGNDLRMVYWQNGTFAELAREINNPGKPYASVSFALNSPVNVQAEDGKYYLYYGNESAIIDQPQKFFPVNSNSLYAVSLGKQTGAEFQTKMSRKWLLLSTNNNINPDFQKMNYQVRINNFNATGKKIAFLVSGPKNLEIAATSTNFNEYEAAVQAASLVPGTYTIQAAIAGTPFKSKSETFFVSYPLYITWTIDYEGFDVSNGNLAALAKVSSDYGMPVTHLFNPRIYIAGDISKERAKYLTDWVIKRNQENHDEIGLHLHMHLDMIKAAGLTPKTEPRWGGRTNGHDVLTSAYNYDEFTQILTWSKKQFADNGLPDPAVYRSGGWFIGLENLRALADNGFSIDTSGHEYFVYGSNHVKSPWHLLSTTKPYLISANDQNSAAAPNLHLWEFPDNGMDSTNNKAALLIQKFDDNYHKQPLTEAQTVTYLSHPHWLTTYDVPQLNQLFKYTGQFKADQDQGPVVYLTLTDAAREWVK